MVFTMSSFFGVSLAENTCIKRFIKVTSRIKPLVTPMVSLRDLIIVYSALMSLPFEPLMATEIKLVSWKATFLAVITTAYRVGENQSLSI